MPEDNSFSVLSKSIRNAVLERGFSKPTEPQLQAFKPILNGENVLLIAPTGTGKTEAVFLPILDRLIESELKLEGIQVLYITPLRALNRDLLERMEWWCKKFDLKLAVRHGDTEVGDRARQSTAPPNILITTPETLQAIITGRNLVRHLRSLRWVVVDEVHELAENKRGVQLSVALERLRLVSGRDFQVIGLSATIGFPDAVSSFLVGSNRNCEVVAAPVSKTVHLKVVFPSPREEDTKLASYLYTLPEVVARLRRIRQIVEEHRSCLIFTNTRSEAEILGSRFRVWDPQFPISVHHGSLSRASRVLAERDLKEGRLRALICTSSLELGIDVGLLDIVVQYGSPRQVSRLIQRVGRSGHKVEGVASGVIITYNSDDMLESLVIVRRALAGELEKPKIPKNCYDVLAHQIIGLLLYKPRWRVDEALGFLKESYPYSDLRKEQFQKVLTYLSERYPRLVWYSEEDDVYSKPFNIQPFYTYYFENLSMIPEEKRFLVLNSVGNEPVGTLDEVFVAEYGEEGVKFVIGGKAWRIIQISSGKIVAEEDNDAEGAIPIWVGEEIPVPYDVAQEVGKLRGEVEEELKKGLSLSSVSENISKRYAGGVEDVSRALQVIEQHVKLKLPVPTDKRITLEKWGDYLVLQCCFGDLVNRCLARLLGHLVSEKFGVTVGVQQDSYRVILKASQVTSQDLKDLILGSARSFDKVVLESIIKTGLFRRRFLHVAKKMGAISKDAVLAGSSLVKVMDAFRESALYDEAVRDSLDVDVDVEESKHVLERICSGEEELSILNVSDLSPTARISSDIGWRSELVTSGRLKQLVLRSAKARLLSEVKTLVCSDCWSYMSSIYVSEMIKDAVCGRCGSRRLGLLNEPEEEVGHLARRIRLSGDRLPPKLSQSRKRIVASADLIAKHGFLAAVGLAARGLSMRQVEELVTGRLGFNDEFVEAVLKAERKALARSFLV